MAHCWQRPSPCRRRPPLTARATESAHIGAASPQEFLGRPLPSSVTIVEVGPRDGLQNEAQKVQGGLGSATGPLSCLGCCTHAARSPLEATVSVHPPAHLFVPSNQPTVCFISLIIGPHRGQG